MSGQRFVVSAVSRNPKAPMAQPRISGATDPEERAATRLEAEPAGASRRRRKHRQRRRGGAQVEPRPSDSVSSNSSGKPAKIPNPT